MIYTSYLIIAREGELRQLRKQTTELEEQNAILSMHIESMKHAIEKLEVEAVQQRSTNMALQGRLDNLRTTLTENFNTVPLPGEKEALGSLNTKLIQTMLTNFIWNVKQQIF